jgi:hypothetical protein
MFPKKVILAISSHGWIHCDEGNPETFIIPEGITVNKITMSTPGNVNFVDPQQLKKSIKSIKKQQKRILDSKKPATVQRAIEDLKESIKDIDKFEVPFLESEKRNTKRPSDEDEIEEYETRKEQIEEYLYGLNKAHKNFILHPGDVVINKRYERENCTATKYDWVMPILNVPGEPDLLNLLRVQTRHGSCNSSLSEIINYFRDNSVEELTIIDFSCSVFLEGDIKKDDLYNLTQREVRNIRRDFLKEDKPYGGNKHKKTNKRKSKIRQTKKRKQNSHNNTKKQFLYNPNDPKKSFDVYIDKNPKDTIHIKYATIDDVKNTINKLERLYKNKNYSHKRIWQVGMIMKVRLEVLKDEKPQQFKLANKYFKFLGERTKLNNNDRHKFNFKI